MSAGRMEELALGLGDKVRLRSGGLVWTVGQVPDERRAYYVMQRPKSSRVLYPSSKDWAHVTVVERAEPTLEGPVRPMAAVGVEISPDGLVVIDGEVFRSRDDAVQVVTCWERPTHWACDRNSPATVSVAKFVDQERRSWLHVRASSLYAEGVTASEAPLTKRAALELSAVLAVMAAGMTD